MRKIKYPKGNELELFHKAYLKYFRIDDRKERHYRYFKESVIDVDLPDSLADLLILSFNDIADISFRLNLTLSQRKWLKMFFNYKTWQPKIASFFMEHQVILGLGSCFYCNIDYINIFSDIKDYKDGIDLIKRGSLNDLKKIKLASNLVYKIFYLKKFVPGYK